MVRANLMTSGHKKLVAAGGVPEQGSVPSTSFASLKGGTPAKWLPQPSSSFNEAHEGDASGAHKRPHIH